MILPNPKFTQPSQAWIDQGKTESDESIVEGSACESQEYGPSVAEKASRLGRDFIGRSKAMQSVLKQIEIVAPTGASVLILGETGTGKELVARAIHNLSGRCHQTFSPINCAAIPSGLLESELFGHEKGSFTGAITRRIGRFELAERGSLFLDEIGDFPPNLQPKLLRVLQEKEFERVGSNQIQKCNVRLIAATSRNLLQMVADGQFRSDLFYRLNVFPIRIPPLRERASDVPLLVRHFVGLVAAKMNKTIDIIPQELMDALKAYPWPETSGSFRILSNAP
ncbi:MAG: sigma 54-interacting transcriptional regulator [Verrucomicrobiota bacterium]